MLDHQSFLLESVMLKTLDDKRMQGDNAYEFETKVEGVYGIRMGTAYSSKARAALAKESLSAHCSPTATENPRTMITFAEVGGSRCLPLSP
jgi:hypothetical protein